MLLLRRGAPRGPLVAGRPFHGAGRFTSSTTWEPIVRGLSTAEPPALRPLPFHKLRAGRGSHIDLLEVDTLLFVGPRSNLFVPPGGRGVFGGQIVGQALHAATRTVPGAIPTTKDEERSWVCHSLHSYFLQVGDPTADVIYHVRKTSDRRSFVTRTVEARQKGETIFTCQASFTRVLGEGASPLEHADPPMPDVPPPEDCPSVRDWFKEMLPKIPSAELRAMVQETLTLPIEMRVVGGLPDMFGHSNPPERPARKIWLKIGEIDSTSARGLDECCAAYCSDHLFLVTALLPHGITFPSPKLGVVASLDHAMYFHSPFRADDWLLYDIRAPRLVHERGLAIGHMYNRAGQLCVTSIQEGVLRLKRPTSKESKEEDAAKARSW